MTKITDAIKGQGVWGTWLTAFVGGLFLLFPKGVDYMCHNQTSYFLYGMRLADASFIPKDWFTWQTFHHDFAFARLIYVLKQIGPLHITAIAAEVVLLTVFAYGLLVLCRKFCSRPLTVYAILIVWLGVISTNEIGLGWQYLFRGFLQPSEVAGCLMAAGLILLLDKKFLLSGIILGFAGLIHGAYLASFGPAILATSIVVGAWRNWRSFLSFAVPMAMTWGLFVIVVARAFASSSPPTQETMALMTYLRSPGDFLVSQWPLDWTLNWFLWAGLGLYVMFRLPDAEKYRELRVCFLALLLTSLVGILQALFIKHQALTLMMLWRSSPMVLILGMAVVIDRCVHLLMNPERVKKEDKVLTVLLVAAALILLNNQWGLESNRRFLWIMAFPLAAASGWFVMIVAKNADLRRKAVTVILLGVMAAVAVKTSYVGLKLSRNFETHPEPASLGEVEQWVRQNTPPDSVFVVPPEMEYMRIRGRRAVVVDWASSCYLPKNLLEWYQRLCDISGVAPKPMVAGPDVLAEGYRRMDSERAKRLRRLYGAEYVVVSAKDHQGNLEGLREKFVNVDYRVLAIP